MPLSVGDAPGVLERVPVATMLYSAYAPAVWQNMAAHERRFVHELFDRMQQFALEYKERARLTDRNERIAYDGGFIPESGAPALESLTANPYVPRVIQRPYMVEDRVLEQQMNHTLARMLPEKMERIARDWELRETAEVRMQNQMNRLLVDQSLLADFDARIRELERRGLVTKEQWIERRPAEGRTVIGTQRVVAPTTPTRCAASPLYDCEALNPRYSNQQLRRSWTGRHSFATTQPDVYSIEIDGNTARILRRGSQPLGTGYDYAGLHNLIQNTVDEYNAASNDTRTMTAETRDRVLKRLEERVRQLELIFNFLAFVAPVRSVDVFVSAADMLGVLQTTQQLFGFLQELAPTTVRLV